MKRFALTSLRARLVGLVLLAILPLVLVLFYGAAGRRRRDAAVAEQYTQQVAQLAAAVETRLVEGARQFLSALAQVPEVRSLEPGAANAVLGKLMEEHRYYTTLGVVALDGAVLSGALPVSPGLNLGDRGWFQGVLRTRRFAGSGYYVGRQSKKQSIGFAGPVLAADGKLQSVVYASFDVSYLGFQLAQLQLPLGARVVVMDPSGVVLASAPSDVVPVGKPMSDSRCLEQVLRGRTAGALRAVGADGAEHFCAYAPVSGIEGGPAAWVMASIPVAVVSAETNRQLYLHLLGLALVAALALAAAWFFSETMILRRVRGLVAAAQRMKAGELSARTGLAYGNDELGELAAVFDEMALAMQQRDAERLRAADALRRSRDELDALVAERAAELVGERDLLRNLLDSLPDYVYVKDRDGHYILDNVMHRSTLGVRQAEDVTGRVPSDFFLPDVAARYHADDQAVLTSGMPLYNREEEIVDSRGNRLWMVTTKVPLRDKDGKVVGVVGIGRDITERKRA